MLMGFHIIIGVLEIFLGIFVLSHKNQTHVHRSFFWICASMGMWSMANGLILLPWSKETVFRGIVDVMFGAGYIIALAILGFSRNFPNRSEGHRMLFRLWYWTTGIALVVIIVCTNLMVTSVHPNASETIQKIEIGTKGFFIYALFFIASLFMAAASFIRKYIRANGLGKTQILYIGLGLMLSLGIGGIFDVLLPLIGHKEYVPYAAFHLVPFLLISSYAILRYRLLDIEVIIKRTSLYLLLVGIVTGFYSFIILVLPQGFTGGLRNTNSIVVLVLSAVLIGVTMQPLREWLDKITDKIFYQNKYDYYQMLEKTSREISAVLKMDELLKIVVEDILAAMHQDKVGVYIKGQHGETNYVCEKKTGPKSESMADTLDEDDYLIEYFTTHKGVLINGEFRHKYEYLYNEGRILDGYKAAIQKTLDEVLCAEVVVPLWIKTNLIGFVVLGEKLSGDHYTERDLTLLGTIANQMVVVLENTRLYEQMLNGERLRVLGSMSASIAHEIRNPLAAVKTFIQMLPNKYEQVEFRQRFNEIVPVEIDRLTRITGDLLTFARPSPPAFSTTDINATLERVVTLLANQIRKKQVEVECKYGELPFIQADGQQLSQVFMNLLLNAVQASHEGGRIFIASSLKIKSGMPTEKGQVVVSVRDEGVGIKAKDMASLFEPFFTTKHEGNGLGLATSRRIANAHQGDIFVESAEGKGANFMVVLPVEPDATLIPKLNPEESEAQTEPFAM